MFFHNLPENKGAALCELVWGSLLSVAGSGCCCFEFLAFLLKCLNVSSRPGLMMDCHDVTVDTREGFDLDISGYRAVFWVTWTNLLTWQDCLPCIEDKLQAVFRALSSIAKCQRHFNGRGPYLLLSNTSAVLGLCSESGSSRLAPITYSKLESWWHCPDNKLYLI